MQSVETGRSRAKREIDRGIPSLTKSVKDGTPSAVRFLERTKEVKNVLLLRFR
jgi:hypothetical protein